MRHQIFYEILTKMKTITFFQNEGKDMNIKENSVKQW